MGSRFVRHNITENKRPALAEEADLSAKLCEFSSPWKYLFSGFTVHRLITTGVHAVTVIYKRILSV